MAKTQWQTCLGIHQRLSSQPQVHWSSPPQFRNGDHPFLRTSCFTHKSHGGCSQLLYEGLVRALKNMKGAVLLYPRSIQRKNLQFKTFERTVCRGTPTVLSRLLLYTQELLWSQMLQPLACRSSTAADSRRRSAPCPPSSHGCLPPRAPCWFQKGGQGCLSHQWESGDIQLWGARSKYSALFFLRERRQKYK